MKIKISDSYGNDVTYELNDCEAAHAFYHQLPIETELINYASNERGFVPYKKLGVFGTPLAPGGLEGLCYYKPWNQVMLIYGGYSSYDELYELGKPVDGQGAVKYLKGPVIIEEF